MKLSDILILKFNLAENRLVDLVSAGKIEFHKILNYQKMIIERVKEEE